MKSLLLSMLALLSVLFFLANVGEAAIDCDFVGTKTAGCVPFVTGKAKDPAPACCSGLKELLEAVKSVDDKRVLCRCMKDAAKSLPINDELLSQLPGRCQIDVGFPISSKMNCAFTELLRS
ncbi:non-specific lipid-transfer protein C, cotyledon-specific isoform-like [Mangifera indica]|uniref:non-specific lipid-transfer protein C, cotyledon-specific isoform-like n=1 Tax=Mangifera indica TaxID=29780 RepID=UPI001CFB1CFC|nr:non-specific lipid-transfer protein C, cotyledon-specific isoform-like [Mangifera indica]